MNLNEHIEQELPQEDQQEKEGQLTTWEDLKKKMMPGYDTEPMRKESEPVATP
jgi:hypothetical protein